MYQIVHITDKDGVSKTDPASQSYLGMIGEAEMEEGCVLIHCRYDGTGTPCDRFIRTSLMKTWKKDPNSGRIAVETMNSVYLLDPVRITQEKRKGETH